MPNPFALKNFLFILCLLIVGNLSVVQAQFQPQQKKQVYHTRSRKAVQYYEKARGYMYRRQYPEAVELLERAIEKDRKFVEAHFSRALCYEQLRKTEQAIESYQEGLELVPKDRVFMNYRLALARLQLKRGYYEEVLANTRKFLSLRPKDPSMVSEAEELEAFAEYARKGVQQPIDIKPVPLPARVNHFPLQYFPVLTVDQNEIVFTARKGFSMADDEDIYICKKDESGEWSLPESISSQINTPDNEGSTALSADGRMLIFTSCNGRRGFGSCDLYVSYKQGEQWSVPENLGRAVNTRAWESQPSLSADGKTLYFVSTRSGGFGKRDIWVSYLSEDGKWSDAVNVGNSVNSAKDEVSPYIHANGRTLFFASQRFPGYGGFDLFYSDKNPEGWSEPENLGYPINNHTDQISLFITADGKKAYYSDESYAEEGGSVTRIYTFDIPESARVKYKSNYVYGKVLDKATGNPLPAKVELFDLKTDSKVSWTQSDSLTGEYMMVLTEGAEYGLYVNREGYLFKSLSFDYKNKAKLKPVYLNIYLEPVTAGAVAQLNNIFFETNEYKLDPRSKTELDKVVSFLNKNETVRIEIAGHTDNVGDASYNRVLSENRAKAVYNYLLKAGVAKGRLEFKGYGQQNPVVPNDSDENRSLNRRIEFKIL